MRKRRAFLGDNRRGAPGLACLGAIFLLTAALTCGAAPLVIDGFDYADSAAARAAWTALAGSPGVDMADSGAWGAERAMVLNCPFSVLNTRCYWDRGAVLDLSGLREFALDLYAADTGATSYFTLYFRSGAGWYGCGAALTRAGRQTLVFSGTDFTEEGTPSGWNQIDGIRLSPWEGADRDAFLAVFELRAYTPPVYVVADMQSSDPNTVINTAGLLLEWLRRFGVSVGVLTNQDVEQGLLAGSRMAILPYNEVITAAEMTELEAFVAGGGKLMVFYFLRGRLPDLLGMDAVDWVQGDFAAYTFSDAVIEHLPARVGQASWNITVAAPRPALNARVIATWEDSNGVPTGQPAWLASDNGLFMSHVLLPDDSVNKQIMLLVLIGHYAPEIWPPAVAAAIDDIGRIAEYTGYAEAVPDIRARGSATPRFAAVESNLALADADRNQALAGQASAAWPEALLSAMEARSHLLDAYYLSQSPVEPEFRAFWEHDGTGPFPGDWPRAIDALVANGFNAVFPNMLWGGLAHYNSALLPHSDEYNTYGDQITACVDAAHARGVEVHVWKVNWNLGRAPQTFIDALRAAGRTQVSAYGVPGDWLCPSHPDNFALERDAMLEVVSNYDVDGIHFDYIRYPDGDHCYCDGCRQRFETDMGQNVTTWPDDVRAGGPLEGSFLDWRRERITRLVDAVYQGTKALKPNVRVSAAVFSEYAYCYDGVGQDWVSWIDRGIVDFLCPMDYTADFDRFRDYVAEQMAFAAGRVPIYPGIGATAAGNGGLGPDEVIVEILATRQALTGGFIVFNFTPTVAGELLPALGVGTTLPMTGSLLRKGAVNSALCPLASRPDLSLLFPVLPPVAPITLPWEDAGFRLAPWEAGSPAGNSCIIFYQVDGVPAVLVVPGSASPAADVRLEVR